MPQPWLGHFERELSRKWEDRHPFFCEGILPEADLAVLDQNNLLNLASIYDPDQGGLRPARGRAEANLALTAGKTLIANGLRKQLPKVEALCTQVERLTSFRVEANAYLSPANSVGFPLHYDLNDALVLQLQGEKLWQIRQRVAPTPLDEPVPDLDSCPMLFELVLKTGGILFIPGGFPHRAACRDGPPSLHITVGVYEMDAGLLLFDFNRRSSLQPRL